MIKDELKWYYLLEASHNETTVILPTTMFLLSTTVETTINTRRQLTSTNPKTHVVEDGPLQIHRQGQQTTQWYSNSMKRYNRSYEAKNDTMKQVIRLLITSASLYDENLDRKLVKILQYRPKRNNTEQEAASLIRIHCLTSSGDSSTVSLTQLIIQACTSGKQKLKTMWKFVCSSTWLMVIMLSLALCPGSHQPTNDTGSHINLILMGVRLDGGTFFEQWKHKWKSTSFDKIGYSSIENELRLVLFDPH
ncbi:unnamed protein product [Didymodactylos carnosus]|uniref:Uncharacterized protein n=1 Tax=Didymodactylos carnosus TaxID=1234261 RepID=A0A815ZF75_9BILA|nr:unnamed protein product [Didymodactylos carnosus]CAF4450037.1 unnamed protein product [Didymodactylos carnosus]